MEKPDDWYQKWEFLQSPAKRFRLYSTYTAEDALKTSILLLLSVKPNGHAFSETKQKLV